jgi:hypothetical protein
MKGRQNGFAWAMQIVDAAASWYSSQRSVPISAFGQHRTLIAYAA